MAIELINTGSELLLGRILNSNQHWICRRMADIGREVTRQLCVPDDTQQIQEVVRESLGRADLVITSGGLGPTSHDLTRDAVAALLGRKLSLDASVLQTIEGYFRQRNRPMPEIIKVQAMVPEGARVLPNRHGTAPGLAIEVTSKKWVVLLPGPPRELHPMFVESVIPFLAEQFPLKEPFFCRTLHTIGMGESMVEQKIAGPLRDLIASGLETGFCARPGEVDVRLAGRGKEAQSLVDRGEAIVRQLLDSLIYSTDDETFEAVIIHRLTKQSQTLALAESCTGGLIANRLTNVPGASEVFICGMVTYSNEAKKDLLGVSAAALEEHGAVSKIVAQEMAENARKRCQTDFAIAVTGIAGPAGGTPEKPVGTVFIAVAGPKQTTVEKHYLPFERTTFKYATSQQAMNLLRREMDLIAK